MTVKVILFLMCSLVFLSGCASISPEERTQNAEVMAAMAGWEKHYIQTAGFVFVAFVPKYLKPSKSLRVYIEGDGLAWQRRTLPSKDPTPVHPMALMMALKDKQSSVYLARPCQYVQGENRKHCEQRYWTRARFSEQVIHATDQAITVLRRQSGAQRLELVGYSGGAAVAALVAARRDDVDKLVTVAGNLDHRAWTALHKVSPLTESLNPPDYWKNLQAIEQLHLVGANDKVIPLSVINSYLQVFPDKNKYDVHIIDGFDHHCCWVKQWPRLLSSDKPH